MWGYTHSVKSGLLTSTRHHVSYECSQHSPPVLSIDKRFCFPEACIAPPPSTCCHSEHAHRTGMQTPATARDGASTRTHAGTPHHRTTMRLVACMCVRAPHCSLHAPGRPAPAGQPLAATATRLGIPSLVGAQSVACMRSSRVLPAACHAPAGPRNHEHPMIGLAFPAGPDCTPPGVPFSLDHHGNEMPEASLFVEIARSASPARRRSLGFLRRPDSS